MKLENEEEQHIRERLLLIFSRMLGEVYMKKNKLLFVGGVSLFLLYGCADREEITFPFSASDVYFIEMYRYTVPADAQTKVILETEDIEALYDSFSGQYVSPGEEENDLSGGTTTSFRFCLNDGTDYEIVYTYGGGRDGEIRFLTEEKKCITSADIGALWDDCNSEPAEVHESRLPGDPCGLTTKPIAGTMLLPGHYVAEGYDPYIEPYLDLYADETAILTYSSVSSDKPMGKITVEDGSLILNDDMFEKKYTFLIDGEDLIFQADRSATIPQLEENTLKDGARFVYREEE